jgi:uncharacterized RDD family membrane protein YckC
MSQSYYLVIKGKPEGPYTIEQLKALQVKPADFIKTSEMDDYKEVHEIAELRVLFGFNKPPVIPQYFGSFDQRLLACVIDWLIIWAVFLVPTFITVLFITNPLVKAVVSLSLFITIPLSYLIYHIVMECSAKQATYGKQLLKIKVCDMQGYRITPGLAAGRNFAKLLSVLTFFVGYLYSFFNKQQQCLHDVVAGTLVMKDRLI